MLSASLPGFKVRRTPKHLLNHNFLSNLDEFTLILVTSSPLDRDVSEIADDNIASSTIETVEFQDFHRVLFHNICSNSSIMEDIQTSCNSSVMTLPVSIQIACNSSVMGQSQ